MNKFVVLLTLIAWYWASTKECAGDANWNRFAISKNYTNFRMVTILDQYITPLYIPKANSLIMARMQCGSACASNKSCQAFNFFETEYSYVCKMRPESLCGADKIRKAFIYQSGSTVWDKPSRGTNITACFEARFNSTTITASCKVMRPGCLGTWPNCSICITNCTVCKARYETPDCTFWLEGDGASQVPMFGQCGLGSTDTILVRRTLTRKYNNLQTAFQLSFHDMNRLFKLTKNTMLQFWCYPTYPSNSYFAIYKNAYIDENGTLMNLTFYNVSTTNVYQSFPAGDILKLNGMAMKPTPFVTVTDDRYSCGSFWLLDTNNATYCPGVGIGVFGANKTNATNYVTETGMRFPGTYCDDFVISYVP